MQVQPGFAGAGRPLWRGLRGSGTRRAQLAYEHPALDLAGVGVGQVGPEHDIVRGPRTPQPGPDVRAQLLSLDRLARHRHDDRGEALAPLLVGYADHDDRLDRRVLDQHILDLGRGDVLAAADDDVVGP